MCSTRAKRAGWECKCKDRLNSRERFLMSVPYALKAADAETVGGLPASAFLKAAANGSASGSSTSQAVAGITGSGTANHITKWLNASKLGNSNIFDGPSGNVASARPALAPLSTSTVRPSCGKMQR